MAFGGKTLTVYLAADLKKFTGPLGSAKRDLNNFDNGLTGFSNKLSSMVGPALLTAGVAAGALAVKLGVEGVQAAADDEVALAKLSSQMENMGFAPFIDSTNRAIGAMQAQYGVSEDILRPAFARLLSSTNDVAQAQSLLKLAMDVSAGTGKSLDTVTQALGKAYDGNTGALGRLGVGIDKATLKSGDLNAITGILSDRFGGTAQANANTFKGSLDRLTLQAGELQEAFGRGVLNSFTKVEGKTDDLITRMGELEPKLETLGETAGNTALDTLDFVTAVIDANDASRDWAASLPVVGGALGRLVDQLRGSIGPLHAFYNIWQFIQGELNGASTTTEGTTQVVNSNTDAINKNAVAAARNAQTRRNALAYWKAQAELEEEEDDRKRRLTTSTGHLTTENDKLTKAFEAQQTVLSQSNSALETAVTKWEAAKKAVTDYADNMSNRILGGLDLGAAFDGQFNEAGERTGQSLITAFDAQIAQAKWFANVLTAIRAQGADQYLIDQIASLGPETGGALGQQMLEQGLVPEINTKWADVRKTVQDQVNATLIPDALLDGVAFAANMVDGLADQVKADQDRLRKIGKAIGKPIGAQMKVEIAEAVAEAVAQAQAAGTAARAEAYAAEERRQQAITNQAIAQMLNKIQSDANARTGYNQAPVVR